jgi:PPOX class probable F420-dependent enzyme
MREMTADERRDFLALGTRTGKLATVRADGRPHGAPVWFVLDGDELVFMTWHDSVKARSIDDNGRRAVVVDEEMFPYAFVLFEGQATISRDAESRRAWARLIAERYAPAELVDTYAERNSVEGELVVRIAPIRVIGRTEMAA